MPPPRPIAGCVGITDRLYDLVRRHRDGEASVHGWFFNGLLAPAVKAVQKISIGSLGLSLMPRPPQFPEPLLAISDHCPVVMEVDF